MLFDFLILNKVKLNNELLQNQSCQFLNIKELAGLIMHKNAKFKGKIYLIELLYSMRPSSHNR
jgi:hypothetical protein